MDNDDTITFIDTLLLFYEKELGTNTVKEIKESINYNNEY